MAGARGPLKLPKHLAAVPSPEAEESAADRVPALAPNKPYAVKQDRELSRLWDQIVPELDRVGLITLSDGLTVELALRHFQLARRASKELAKGKLVVHDDKNGRDMKNPSEVIFRSESELFLKYAAQLGMTFVSRARTPAGRGGDDDDANPFSPSS